MDPQISGKPLLGCTSMTTTPSISPSAGKGRRKYTKEFKQQAIALAHRPDLGFRQAASDLGINESMLRTWAHQAGQEGPEAFRGNGVRTEQETRIAALEREVRILREERDILKKATEFFVKEKR